MADPLSIAKSGIQQATINMTNLSDNMANSKSIAGKGSSYFISSMSENVNGSAMGVTGTVLKNINQPGKTVNVDNAMWCSSGNKGFFVVDNGFTRVGTWTFDQNGTCVNHLGNKVKVYRVNASGQKVDPNNITQTISDNTAQTYMTHIDTKNLRLNAAATTSVSYGYELPSKATDGTTIKSDISVYDSLGTQHNLTYTYTKAQVYSPGANTYYVVPPGATAGDTTTNILATSGCSSAWYLTITSSTTGDVINAPYTSAGNGMLMEFDANGNPLNFNNSVVVNTGAPVTVTASPPNLTTTYADLSTAGNITLNLGTIGQNNGIVSRGEVAKVINVQADGNADGLFQSLEWTSDGYGIVKFDNNVKQKMFQFVMAYFPNTDGLTYGKDGVYRESANSGGALYGVPGDGNIDPIIVSSYEESNISAIDTQIDIIENQRYYMGQISSFRAAKEALSALDNI